MACDHLGARRSPPTGSPGAGDCPECEAAARRLADIRQTLAGFDPEPTPGSRARTWQAVAEAVDGRRGFAWRPWIAGGALAAVAAAAMVIVSSGGPRSVSEHEVLAPMDGATARGTTVPEAALAEAAEAAASGDEMPSPDPAPVSPDGLRVVSGSVRSVPLDRRIDAGGLLPDGAVEIPRLARIDLGIGELDLGEGARFEASVHEAAGPVIRLERGRLGAWIDPARTEGTFAVRTPHGRIEVVGTRFSVTTEARTTSVEVAAGAVRVFPRDEAGSFVLEAGEAVVLPRPRASVARAGPPPSDAPRPAPVAEPAPADAVRTARQVVTSDPDRAADLAGRVLDARPEPGIEVLALAVLADAHRRKGEAEAAAGLYRRVADHPEAGAVAEEALLRLAHLDLAAGRPGEVLAVVDESDRRFAGGVLAPERAAVRARAHLAAGRPAEAAAALEVLPRAPATVEVHALRVEVAEALLPQDPARARRIVDPVLHAPVPTGLRAAAESVARHAERDRPAD